MEVANYINTYSSQTDYDNAVKQYPNVSLVGNNVVWKAEPPHDYSKDYLTFIPLSADTTFKLIGSKSIYYSLDSGSTWTFLNYNKNTPSVAVGNKIMFKANLTPSSNGIGNFVSNDNNPFDVEGNIMSMLYGDNFSGQTSLSGKSHVFETFFNNAKIVNAENLVLPATTLESNCYYYMFWGCNLLITAPKLPATTLAQACYHSMFRGCTSLETAPLLPATTLTDVCYYYMFHDCTSLNNVTCLATNLDGINPLSSWLGGVSSSGTFTKSASITTSEWGYNIPSNWTVQDYQG